jgi:5,10-methylenetetrahydromethanopterin reductase
MTTERFALGITNCRSAEKVVAGINEAETLGAEIAFVAEDIGCRDAFELLAATATKTSRIRLATGVVNPYTRSPMALAMAIATLDDVSGGRAVLGIGSSSPEQIEVQLGIARRSTVSDMRESLEIVRRLLAGETVTYSGHRFSYADSRLEFATARARTPIFLAAMGPKMLRLAGAIADGVLLNVGASTQYVHWAVEHIRSGASEADRDLTEITVAAWLTAYIADDVESVMPRARQWLASTLSIRAQGELLLEHAEIDASILGPIRALVGAYPHSGDRAAAAQHVPREAIERMALVGNVRHVSDRVKEYRDAGVQLPVMAIGALRALYG